MTTAQPPKGATAMEFHLLGPLEVIDGGRPLRLGGSKERCVLALLLLQPNQIVSIDRMIDDLWGDRLPGDPRSTLHVYIANLRKLLGGRRAGAGGAPTSPSIETTKHGYVLHVSTDQHDVLLFDELVAKGRARLVAGDHGQASEDLGRALQLWRGPFLADLAFEDFVQARAAQLEEIRLSALEDRMDAELALGHHAQLVADLEVVVSQQPLRERLRGQLMTALYRCGRQAEALRAYDQAQDVLVEELGIDPSPALRQLRQAILTQDPSLDAVAGPTVTPDAGEDDRRPYREFGQWVRSRRTARGWTIEELAHRLDCATAELESVEWGQRRPSPALRDQLAQLFDVPASVVAASTRSSPQGRLPKPPTPLFGRHHEADEIVGILLQNRLVTLVGAPGVGKTRLALAVAGLLDERLEQGAYFIPLSAVNAPAGVAVAIASCLGLPMTADEDTADRLVDHLAAREVLLVLDNFEHVLEAAPVAGRLVAEAPGVRLLVTSREPLRLGPEWCYPVPPLAVPDPTALGASADMRDVPAVALFVDRARRVRPGFALTSQNAGAVAGVCARLDGLPLAIELAAATARVLSPEAICRRLDQHLDLPVLGPRDAPAHQRTLRATIGWSHDLLSQDEQVLLARLATFAGGFTLESAAAVCQRPGEELDTVTVVASLTAKSLLEPKPDAAGGPRFALLTAVRDFALERLVERAEDEVMRAAHARHFADLAEEAAPQLLGAEQVHWLNVLEDEHVNLASALAWYIQRAPDAAVGPAGALWRFWWMRGHLNEGRQWLEQALALSDDKSPQRVRALNGAGVLARAQNDYGHASELFESALGLADQLDLEDGMALALINLGLIAENRGEYGEAMELFDRSLSMYRALQNPRGVGHALNCLGMVHIDLGEFGTAAHLLEESITGLRQLGDLWSVALVANNLGWVAYKQGESSRARGWYEQSLSVCKQLRDQEGIARALSNLGRVARQQGDAQAALGFLEEALVLFRRLGEKRDMAECLEELAAAADAVGASSRAARLLGAAERLRTVIGAPLWPSEREELAQTQASTRAHLGTGMFDSTSAEGRMIGLDEAVALALGRGAGLGEARSS